MFCCTFLCVHSSFAIISMGKRELVTLLCLSFWCLVIVVWLFLTMQWVCLQFVIVVFLDHTHYFFPRRVAQSVTCLATDASLTADPGVASSIPARSHTFVEIDHEIISTVILLPSAESFKKGCCQLQAKVCARSTG